MGKEGRYINDPKDGVGAHLDFGISDDGKTGYVYNGDWYFKVLEFNPPYMKIKVDHPRAAPFVECFNVHKV